MPRYSIGWNASTMSPATESNISDRHIHPSPSNSALSPRFSRLLSLLGCLLSCLAPLNYGVRHAAVTERGRVSDEHPQRFRCYAATPISGASGERRRYPTCLNCCLECPLAEHVPNNACLVPVQQVAYATLRGRSLTSVISSCPGSLKYHRSCRC
jgi:hypothetical protein